MLNALDRKKMEEERLTRQNARLAKHNRVASELTSPPVTSMNTTSTRQRLSSEVIDLDTPALKRKKIEIDHTPILSRSSPIVIDDDEEEGEVSNQTRPRLHSSRKIARSNVAANRELHQAQVLSDESTDDSDLKQAIALSLELSCQGNSNKKSSVIDKVSGPSNFEPTYFQGRVFLTSSSIHVNSSTEHVTIDVLLQVPYLEKAVLSSFVWDSQWVVNLFNRAGAPVDLIFVMSEKSEKNQALFREQISEIPALKLHFPDLKHASIVHSKLMLLFYGAPGSQQWLRVVVPSANLIRPDWGFGGLMENILYVQDFPVFTQTTERDDTTDEENESGEGSFGSDLIYYCRKASYPADILSALSAFDFTAADRAGVRFVASIGGNSNGEAAIRRTGHQALAAAIRNLDLNPKGDQQVLVEAMISSIGSLDKKFLTTLMSAFEGKFLSLDIRKALPSDREYENLCKRLRIFFPSRKTVVESNGRDLCGGSICFQPSHYNGKEFPRESLFDHSARRVGMLSHCKIFLVSHFSNTKVKDETQSANEIAFAYIGSANLSMSAWGGPITQKPNDGSKIKTPNLHVRNWETGVLVPKNMIIGKVPVRLTKRVENTDPWFFMT